MKNIVQKLVGVAALTLGLLCGCTPDNNPVSGKLAVAAGLPPVGFIAQQLSGGRIEVYTMLPEGRSPHDYAPGAQDIRQASSAKRFFTTCMTFENSISRALPSQAQVVDVSKNIQRIPFAAESCHHHHHGKIPDHEALDPHVWLSPVNAQLIAKNICREFIALDPAGKAIYEKNLAALNAKFAAQAQQIKKTLAPYQGRTFFVYHPAFGYFAQFAGLHQKGIELGGREAYPARIAEVIKEAREYQVKAVFVQPQFNPASGRALGQAIQGEVIELDPLAGNLPENFSKMTGALLRGFSGRDVVESNGKNN